MTEDGVFHLALQNRCPSIKMGRQAERITNCRVPLAQWKRATLRKWRSGVRIPDGTNHLRRWNHLIPAAFVL